MSDPNFSISSDYYSRDRKWPSLFPLIRGGKFLDIGCGKGVLGRFLKDQFEAKVTGVELFEEYANESANYLDKVICGNFENINFISLEGTFDYVIFSDSLEHLYDPKLALNKAKLLINPSGSILISIPNIRNFRVLIPLLFLGRFEYQDEGLLDRTHLRFFTRSSIVKLLRECGLEVTSIQYDLPVASKTGILNLLTLGLFRDILTSHYFISSCKRNL